MRKLTRAPHQVEACFTLPQLAKFQSWPSACPWPSISSSLAFYQMEMPYSYKSLHDDFYDGLTLYLSSNVFALPYNLTEDKHSNWRRFSSTIHRYLWVQYYLVKALRFALLYSLAIA